MNVWVIGIGSERPETVKTHKAFFTGLLFTLVEDLSQVAPLDQENLNLEELANFVVDKYPKIYRNEVATWQYILEKGQMIVGKLIQFLLSAPPTDAVDNTIDILTAICTYIPAKYKQAWFVSAF